MVSIVIKKDSKSNLIGFSCIGHANYAKKGSDIICAGISVLTHSTVLALEKLTCLSIKVKQNARRGSLECSWDHNPQETERLNLIIEVMLIGLTEIQRQYPEYLNVSEAEV